VSFILASTCWSVCLRRRSDAQLTVVSYNILAQKYIDAGYHGDEAWLSWSHRQPRILAELDSYAADVICLQEVLNSRASRAALSWRPAASSVLRPAVELTAKDRSVSQVEQPTWETSILPHFQQQGFEARPVSRQHCENQHQVHVTASPHRRMVCAGAVLRTAISTERGRAWSSGRLRPAHA